jgi:hypothetical protein
MWMLAVVAMLLPGLFIATVEGQRMERESPTEVRVAKSEIANLRVFAYLVNKYLANNPTYTGTLTAATVLASTSTPPTLRNTQINPAWYATVTNAGNYTLYTAMSDQAATAISQIIPSSTQVTTQNGINIITIIPGAMTWN